jgi:DNA-binding response OmpR family regulator
LDVQRGELCKRIRSEAPADIGEAMLSIRILLADRDELLLATYREHLSRHGAIVSTATSGLACLDRLRDFAPDILVLDPSLLWGGSEGVLAVMHEEPEIRPACVLLLADSGNRRLLYRLSSFRVDDYQTKPIDASQLMERIRRMRMLPIINPILNRTAASSPITS